MDLTTLALCKKLISKATTGISNISSEDGKLIFTMADSSKITVSLPIKEDAVDFNFTDSLPTTGVENRVYVVKTGSKDSAGNDIYQQYMWVDGAWVLGGISGMLLAAASQVGLVKPDSQSINVDSTGTLSVDIDYIRSQIEEKIQSSDEGTTTTDDVDSLFG